MRSYRGIITDHTAELMKAVIERVAYNAYAESEGGDPASGGDEGGDSKNTPTINYEDLIAKARREEKQKQYKTIERLKSQIETLTKQHNDDLLKQADLEKQLKEAKEKFTSAGSGDSEEIKSLKFTIKTLEGEKADLDKKVKDFEKNKPQSREEIEKEVREELEKEYEVKTYKTTKMAELKDQLLVPELVVGDTKEEIDESIKAALARSEEIRKSLGIPAGGGEGNPEPPKPKNKRTPKSPAGIQIGGKEVTLEHLASLDVRSKEYAEMRKQLGLK